MNERICQFCNSNKTYILSNRYPNWTNINNKPCCSICKSKINNPKYSRKRICYKNQRKIVKEKDLKGICSICEKKIGDIYINKYDKILTVRRTSMHHLKYHDNNILKDTIEVCNSCHAKITWKDNKIDKEKILKIPIPMNQRKCDFCKSSTTYIDNKKRSPCWHNINGSLSCRKCYARYYNKNKRK